MTLRKKMITVTPVPKVLYRLLEATLKDGTLTFKATDKEPKPEPASEPLGWHHVHALMLWWFANAEEYEVRARVNIYHKLFYSMADKLAIRVYESNYNMAGNIKESPPANPIPAEEPDIKEKTGCSKNEKSENKNPSDSSETPASGTTGSSNVISEILRERAAFFVNYCHTLFTLQPAEELARVQIVRFVKNICYMTLIVPVFLILLFFINDFVHFLFQTKTPPELIRYGKWSLLFSMVAVAGSFGAFFSFQRRTYAAAARGRILITIIEQPKNLRNLDLIPTTGAVFAIILMCIFIGGFVKGTVFPEFNGPLVDILHNKENLSKLLVWSFIAGFAERFVPDILDKITKREENSSEE